MTEFEYRNTLDALNRGKIVHWDPVMQGGRNLWERLTDDMLACPCTLSVRQQVNSLIVLIRLRAWGNHAALISVLKSAAESHEIEVRNQAARLMAGLVRLCSRGSHRNEQIDKRNIVSHLRLALSKGVDSETYALAASVLNDEPDA